jgi:hypothetical protein
MAGLQRRQTFSTARSSSWRRTTALAAAFAGVSWFAACASDDSGAQISDDGPWRSDGYSGPSLCTSERTPADAGCGHDGKIGSARALALAREEVPAAPLIRVMSHGGQLDVDGLDLGWRFEFEDIESGALLTVFTEGDTAMPVERSTENAPCGEAAEIELLDSERFVPDAVLRFEMREATFAGSLHMEQDGCLYRPEMHFVMLDAHPEPIAPYYARYWDDGTFIELVGPCLRHIEFCLDGYER